MVWFLRNIWYYGSETEPAKDGLQSPANSARPLFTSPWPALGRMCRICFRLHLSQSRFFHGCPPLCDNIQLCDRRFFLWVPPLATISEYHNQESLSIDGIKKIFLSDYAVAVLRRMCKVPVDELHVTILKIGDFSVADAKNRSVLHLYSAFYIIYELYLCFIN